MPVRRAIAALRAGLVVALTWAALGVSGCSAIPVNVSNPIPGMTTVAVAPFFNLSAEPTVDGRRFAMAYYSELQKTANYQVIPVGVVEEAIKENELDMSSPSDAIKLAEILDADAVVIGAVTDYDPYYPPQLSLQVRWYSPREWVFFPGVGAPANSCLPPPVRPAPDECSFDRCDFPARPAQSLPTGPRAPADQDQTPTTAQPATGAPAVRGQSPDNPNDRGSYVSLPPAIPSRIAQSKGRGGPSIPSQMNEWPPGIDALAPPSRPAQGPVRGDSSGAFTVQGQIDEPQPLMSYTRFFDGGDKDLVARLKAYYHLRGDMRSGSWMAYLHRSDDFLRFTAHLMIVEMLSLHGASVKTDYYFSFWNWR